VLPGLEQLILTCAPQVAPSTMGAIVRVESGGRPYALNVNGAQKLTRQPRDAEEATAWANWLVARGYSVDMGLTQVNSGNLARLGLTPQQLFDPCTNLRAGSSILTENYLGAAKQYGSGQIALKAALSAYNTGNYKAGIANGYVAKVTAAADGRRAPPLGPANPVTQAVNHEAGAPHSPTVMWVKR
jgi:type IV secretion system protein VirB1